MKFFRELLDRAVCREQTRRHELEAIEFRIGKLIGFIDESYSISECTIRSAAAEETANANERTLEFVLKQIQEARLRLDALEAK